MRKITNKKIAAVALGAVALTGTGVAYAYWTTTGSGTGSAAASAGNGVVTLHASFPASALAPGAPQTVTYTADNANTYSTLVGALTVTGVTVDAASATDGCLAADFSATAVSSNATVGASQLGVTVGSGVITMANTPVDQSACKNATITINVTSA